MCTLLLPHPLIPGVKFELSYDSYLCIFVNISLTVPRRCFFCGSFLLGMLHVDVCCAIASVPCALWSPDGKGLTSLISFMVYNCEFVTFPLVS